MKQLVVSISEELFNKMVDVSKLPELELARDFTKAFVKSIVNGKPLDSVLDEIRAEIELKCDRINSLASVLPYTAHREIQELLCEIMNLCKTESEDKE